MNNFHVYEAIGRGKHSTVYKGRKKKTIEYYAIKSVDKSQRSKVLQEVRILHFLDHPNIQKFYAWYETSAHLWLVLEYCVGGDLMALLRQDSRLPEDSIHDLAFDLVTALQFLHSKGIIYCDLKPSNILLDENGHTKLCDFGLTRRLSDIEKSSISTLPQSKRGTPCYMAPELFQDGGVHSHASDFWALGCILYECYAGTPPFIANEFTQLVKSIISDPTPSLPDNPTSSFVNLINCLLIKDPAERLQWPELCGHAFWNKKICLVTLPPQPAFNNMLQTLKPYLSERNGDRPSQPKTPSKCLENNSNGASKLEEDYISGSKALVTPAKNTYSGRKTHTKASVRGEDKQKEAFKAGKGANILRLSRIAKLNMQKEKEKENYRRPLAKSHENDSEVNIENNDMELDFSENLEDDSTDESDGSESHPFTPAEKLPTHLDEKIEDIDHHVSHSDIPPDNISAALDDRREDIELTPTPPSGNLQRRAQNSKVASEDDPDSDLPKDSKASNDISEVMWHPSDLSVKPVMPSRKGDKVSDAIPHLPFETVHVGDYVKLPLEQLNVLNSRIIHSLSGSSLVAEKQNVIRYLEMLSGNSDAANIITNGPIMLLLVKMLRLSKVSVIRAQLATVIGLLIRHSTYIEADLEASGIVNALTDGLRDKQDKVRRFSMAALGELLFYISTQTEHNAKDSNVNESPSKENRLTSAWQVPSSVIALVSSILRKGEDDVTQLYALRTIENVCSQGGDWASRFASQGVIGNLCYIFKATCKQENTRLIAGSCLVRLARFNPPIIQLVFEKLLLKDTASTLIKGTPREQQTSLNLLNLAILNSHMFTNMGRHLASLTEEKHLVAGITSLIEHGSEALRGKALLFVALLCKNSCRWLPHFLCSAKLLSIIDRLVKEKDNFIHQCMEAFVHSVVGTVPSILENVYGDIQHLAATKRHGPIAALSGRGNPKGIAPLFPVVLHLLGSSSFKHKVVNSKVLLLLANLIKLLEVPFQGRDDFQITLLRILESITEESSVILDEPLMFTNRILPSLVILYKGNKDADARFLCLKILFDVMLVIFTDMPDTSLTEEQIMKDLKSISETYFLPIYPSLIEDEDPIPMYAQKLLVILLEFKYISVSDIANPRTVSRCFEFLLCDLSNANANNVKLCFTLASAPDMDTKILSDLHVVRKIGNLLEFVNAREMEDFLEPTLDLCKEFILRGIGSNKGVAIANEPALLGNVTFDMSIVVDQHYCIKDIADFGSNMDTFLELIGSQVPRISDIASECMVLLMKAAPREATMGLLASLPRVGILLESLPCDASPLKLLRLLYSIAFSCRQYLSHAMMLSISIPAVIRIETLVSSLKNSSLPGITEAASNLVGQLQRLPRCI